MPYIFNSKRARNFQDCNEIPFLKWPGNSPKMNFIENVWNIMTKEIDGQMLCLKEEIWKRVSEVWYSEALNVMEELYNLMPRRIADLIILLRKGRCNEY